MAINLTCLSQDSLWDMVEEIDSLGEGLTEWEVDFVESLMEQRASSPAMKLSSRQASHIQTIHQNRIH